MSMFDEKVAEVRHCFEKIIEGVPEGLLDTLAIGLVITLERFERDTPKVNVYRKGNRAGHSDFPEDHQSGNAAPRAQNLGEYPG